MSPRIIPIGTKRSTINISCRPSRIRLEWHGSRHSTRKGNLMFPSISRLFIHSFIHSGHFYSAPSSPLLLRGASFVGGGPNCIAKLDGDPWPEFPLESTTESL